MPPASTRECDYPGCRSGPRGPNGEENPFVTSSDLPTRADVSAELDKHVEMAHLLPIRLEENRTKTIEAEAQATKAEANKIHEETQRILASNQKTASTNGSSSPSSASTGSTDTTSAPRPHIEKRDALQRPTIKENASSSGWSFFVAQWDRYVAGVNMSPSQQVHHLWAACSIDIQRHLHNRGSKNVADPAVLLEDIRMIAVKRKNNLVNVVELQRMGQKPQETITQYTSRLMGQADVCDFVTTCSSCDQDVSFKDKISQGLRIRRNPSFGFGFGFNFGFGFVFCFVLGFLFVFVLFWFRFLFWFLLWFWFGFGFGFSLDFVFVFVLGLS